ncbi:hypothetical protein [Rhodoplanes serenus]|uniref:hypothetical protein n=1 Tax=Rhodoplanes serenus TaxID=200615 RepID=UPI000DAC358C|nr:hypothetical protein [Rhodoplanes serenus]RAI34435.1 hypothetical protein CH340_09105 [Rhodoplanes serenus]
MKTPSDRSLMVCAIPGCGRAPEARQGNGLSPTLCRYHREFRSRHGSPMKRSYMGAALKPYIAAAESILKAHAETFFVRAALDGIATTLATAGPVRRVVDLGRLHPETKARAALAMLRERDVPPSRILAVALGVLAAIEEDPFGPGGDRRLFRRVQIAKALRRRASGTHAVYGPGNQFDRYPRSAGRVLEALGTIVEALVEHVAADHLSTILAFKIARYGSLEPPAMAPVARSRFGRSRVPEPLPPEDAEPAAGRVSPGDLREADRITDEVRREFAERGFAAFKGKF